MDKQKRRIWDATAASWPEPPSWAERRRKNRALASRISEDGLAKLLLEVRKRKEIARLRGAKESSRSGPKMRRTPRAHSPANGLHVTSEKETTMT
jgi:hypothetical protein